MAPRYSADRLPQDQRQALESMAMTLTFINLRDPIFAAEREDEDQIEASCFDCGGEGGWAIASGGYDWQTGEPLGYWETCPSCEGRGGGFIQAYPLTLEDLADLDEMIAEQD